MLQTLANFSIEGTSPEQIILALTNLEKVGRRFPAGQVGQALAPYFNSEYFLVQVKAFLTLGRIGQAADCKVPFSFWQEYRQQPAWQLQALDAFWQIPDDAKTKTSILLSQLEQEQHPTTLRGLVWLLGQSESPLAVVGLGFFLASKRQLEVKDEVLHEAWFTLAQRFPAEAEKVVKNMPDLACGCAIEFGGKRHYIIFIQPQIIFGKLPKNKVCAKKTFGGFITVLDKKRKLLLPEKGMQQKACPHLVDSCKKKTEKRPLASTLRA